MRRTTLRNLLVLAVTVVLGGLTYACVDDATTASYNLSRAADNFEVDRRVVFYNSWTGDYMMTIEGRCSILDERRQLEVVCKTGHRDFRKHFLGLGQSVTYFAEQLSPGDVSAYHYRLTFKPQVIVPDFDFRADPAALTADKSEAMQ